MKERSLTPRIAAASYPTKERRFGAKVLASMEVERARDPFTCGTQYHGMHPMHGVIASSGEWTVFKPVV